MGRARFPRPIDCARDVRRASATNLAFHRNDRRQGCFPVSRAMRKSSRNSRLPHNGGSPIATIRINDFAVIDPG